MSGDDNRPGIIDPTMAAIVAWEIENRDKILTPQQLLVVAQTLSSLAGGTEGAEQQPLTPDRLRDLAITLSNISLQQEEEAA